MRYARCVVVALAGVAFGTAGCGEPVPEQLPDYCDSVDFVGCGGDINGVWYVTDSCYSESQPSLESCPSAEVDLTSSGSGTLEFDGGSYEWNYQTTVHQSWSVPQMCLDEGQSCSDLSTYKLDFGRSEDGCGASYTAEDSETLDGGYSVKDARLTIRLDRDTTVDTRYCVDGDNLIIRIPHPDGDVSYVTARRD